MPKISIIMAAFNSADYIANAIDSILSQDFSNFELIVINDGSTDNTKLIIENYKAIDDRIILINQENNGPGAARNAGIKKAGGEYLLIIDSDDKLNKSALSEFNNATLQEPDLVACGYYMQEDNGSPKLFTLDSFSTYTHSSFLNLLPSIINAHLGYITWNKLYKKSIIDKYNIEFTEFKSCEDRLFNISYYRYVNKFCFTDKPLYTYFVRGDSGLNTKFLPDRADSLDEFYKSILTLYENKIDDTAIAVYSNAYIKGIYATILSTFHESCSLTKKEKKQYIKSLICRHNVKTATKSGKKNISMFIPIICLKTRSVNLNIFCAKLIKFADTKMHSLFMKLKHRK